MPNTDVLVKEVSAPEKAPALREKGTEKDFLSKKKKRRFSEILIEKKEEIDFVKDVKDAVMYGDIGHGIMVDKKV